MAELSKKTTFLDLNVDCLLKVFDYCSDRDLFSLWRVHNSLRDIVELCIAKKKSQLILLANPASKILEQRTRDRLTYDERVLLSYHWRRGICETSSYYNNYYRYFGKVMIDKNYIYVNCRKCLKICERSDAKPLDLENVQNIYYPHTGQFVDFTVQDDTMFAATHNSVLVYNKSCEKGHQKMDNECGPIKCIDLQDNVHVVGSKNGCKILRPQNNELDEVKFDVSDVSKFVYQMVQFKPYSNNRFTGIYTFQKEHKIHEFDIESGQAYQCKIYSRHYNDLKYKDNNILYVTDGQTLMVYDIRVQGVQFTWDNPTGFQFTCLDHDGLNAILLGSTKKCLFLYDTRLPAYVVQIHCINSDLQSPITSVAFDSRYAFASSRNEIFALDFKQGKSRCEVSQCPNSIPFYLMEIMP